jgi:hypothetical protein
LSRAALKEKEKAGEMREAVPAREITNSRKRVVRRDTAPGPAPGFDASPGDPATKTLHDWHAPPELAQPPPKKTKTPVSRWVGFVVACLAVTAMAYLMIGKRLHVENLDAIGSPPRSLTSLLSPTGGDARDGKATLFLETDVPARVFVDGFDTGMTTPISGYVLEPGVRKVRLVQPETRETMELMLTVKAGEEVRRRESFPNRVAPSKPSAAPRPIGRKAGAAPEKKGPSGRGR